MKLEDIIVDERDDYFIINKPAGLVVHYSYTNPHAETVAILLKDKVEDDGSDRAGIVHRLDKNTSGLMIIAKNTKFKKYIIDQFKNHLVKKKYIGLVHGRLKHHNALIDLPIGRDSIKRYKMKILSNGKPAKTVYKVINSNGKYSLLDLDLLTGRTHQIRLHLSHLGHPIVGDTIYAPSKRDALDRYFLQSYYIAFNDLSGKEYSKTIPIDKDLKQFLSIVDMNEINTNTLLSQSHPRV